MWKPQHIFYNYSKKVDFFCNIIYIYAFSKRFYPKRLTVHSGYIFIVSMCVSWELKPTTFALLTQCSTTEPQEHIMNVFTVTWSNKHFLDKYKLFIKHSLSSNF